MSIRMSDPRHDRAGRALSDLGDARSEHEVLSVQCSHSHHVATVYRTPAGLVFHSITGPHAHGRMDRADVAHRGHEHGLEYVEMLDSDQADDDLVTEKSGVRVVVDPSSAQLLTGATLDYKDGLQQAGFSIDNPNAQRTCGCGSSFS